MQRPEPNGEKAGTWEFVVRRVSDGTAVAVHGLLCIRGKGTSRDAAKRDCIAHASKASGIPEDGLEITGDGTAEDIAAMEIDHS